VPPERLRVLRLRRARVFGSQIFIVLGIFDMVGCRDPGPPVRGQSGLVISEIVADNDGVYLDEALEADDYIELTNLGPEPVELSDYAIANNGGAQPLPRKAMAPGDAIVLHADNTLKQGPYHLDFRLSASGESVHLRKGANGVDDVTYLLLPTNESFFRPAGSSELQICRYPTPGRRNETCAPPAPPPPRPDVTFTPYVWPAPWPSSNTPLLIVEAGLRPAAFIEILNTSIADVDLTAFTIRLAPTGPGRPWPTPDQGVALSMHRADASVRNTIAPGEIALVHLKPTDTDAIALDPAFEGVATIFDATGIAVDRLDFMRWPENTILARPAANAPFAYCRNATPGLANPACDAVPNRDVGDRVRYLRTPGDFEALARGATATSMEPVKFVVERETGAVQLLSSAAWPLHYSWVRERIDGDVHLDVCIPEQNQMFQQGWYDFSLREYFVPEGGRYHLGTLVRHSGANLSTIEFAMGDAITAERMKDAFFKVVAHTPNPTDWVIRPQTDDQVAQVRKVEGSVPAIGPDAPYRGITYQPLTHAVGFGTLTFISAADLTKTVVLPQTILVTDDVPNDIPLMGGIITESFQTPLSHVNVLSRGRGTPNMVLRNARSDPRVISLLNQPVRLEVRSDGFDLRLASAEEVATFWALRAARTPLQPPALDLSVKSLQPITGLTIADIPRVGGKAAQMGELAHVNSLRKACPGPMGVPPDAFAIPLAHGAAHTETSGARPLIETLLNDPVLRKDVNLRDPALAAIRNKILAQPIEKALLSTVTSAIERRYGKNRVRMRSSSNTEDLQGFGGAGLYHSMSAAIGDPERRIDDGMRTVWASMWSARAFAERELYGVDHRKVAMGVLVHEGFLSEEANGVGVSRNLLDPGDESSYTVNVQLGEASVTNPAPGVTSEQFLYHWGRTQPITWQEHSSFLRDGNVLRVGEIDLLVCRLRAIHDHFKPRVDPENKVPWFAMEIEFKIDDTPTPVEGIRKLSIKQARPFNFGPADVPADCRDRL
jgi:Pyruvate phosphate dikinase, AMP/ATP-binding domain/Lamin Tail Domain